MREQYMPCHKYDRPFTAWLDEKCDGDTSWYDDEVGNVSEDGLHAYRVGRRVVSTDAQGFIWCGTHVDVPTAELAMMEIEAELRWNRPDDEADAFIYHTGNVWCFEISNDAFCKIDPEATDTYAELRECFRDANYYPNVWYVDDHGGIERIDIW